MNTAIRVIGCVFMLLSLAACDFCLYNEEFLYAGIMLICALVFFIIVCCVRRKNTAVVFAADAAVAGNSPMYAESNNSSVFSGSVGKTTADSKKSRKAKAYSQPWRDVDDAMPAVTPSAAFMSDASFASAAGQPASDPVVRPSSSGNSNSYASTSYNAGYYSAGPEKEGTYSTNLVNSGAIQRSAHPSETPNPGNFNGRNLAPDPAKGYFDQMPGFTPPSPAARPAAQAAFPAAKAGIKYMRYCKGCGFLGSQLATEVVPPCPTCGAKLFASDVPLSEFTMLDQRKRSALMRKWSKEG